MALIVTQDGSLQALKRHVEEEARDLSGEAFSRFMDQLYDYVSALLVSNDVADNLGALRAIDELIDITVGESASKVPKFSGYLHNVFDVKRDPEILVLASGVLGHLARAGGAMTADEVERQVKLYIFMASVTSFSNSLYLFVGYDSMTVHFIWQVKNALEWLRGDRIEYRRFAAVLILKVSAISFRHICHNYNSKMLFMPLLFFHHHHHYFFIIIIILFV